MYVRFYHSDLSASTNSMFLFCFQQLSQEEEEAKKAEKGLKEEAEARKKAEKVSIVPNPCIACCP